MKDAWRQRVYNCERAWHKSDALAAKVVGPNQAQEILNELAARHGIPQVTVKIRDLGRKYSGMYYSRRAEVHLSEPILVKSVLHEFAHHLNFCEDRPARGHGADYTDTMVRVVEDWLGYESAGMLQDAYIDGEVPVSRDIEKELIEKAKAKRAYIRDRIGETGTVFAVVVNYNRVDDWYLAESATSIGSEPFRAKAYRREASAVKLAEKLSKDPRHDVKVVELDATYTDRDDYTGYYVRTANWHINYEAWTQLLRELKGETE